MLLVKSRSVTTSAGNSSELFQSGQNVNTTEILENLVKEHCGKLICIKTIIIYCQTKVYHTPPFFDLLKEKCIIIYYYVFCQCSNVRLFYSVCRIFFKSNKLGLKFY